MKNLIIISNYDDIKNPYYAGGGAYAVHEVAKRLTKKFDIKIITGKYPQSKNTVVDGVAYERIGFSFGGPKVGQLIYQLLLPYYIKNKKFDVWAESFTPPFSTNFLQLYTNKPVVGLIHMLAGDDMKRKYKLPFNLIENLGLKTYKYFISTSDLIKERVAKQNLQASIEVIPNGIENIKISRSNKKEYILFLGRIEVDQKGLDLLLDGFEKINAKIGYKLAIAGNGETKQINILKKLIKQKRLGKSVILLGRVDGKKKKQILEKAFCIVLPSRFETFSIVALEALAFGIPLITFDIDGLSWIPNNCRIKIKSFDIQALSKKIISLSNDKDMQKKLITNGKKFTQQYTWGKVAQKYQNYFNYILKNK
jgi:glycosyltransferase involved in cell wall biosynthesis